MATLTLVVPIFNEASHLRLFLQTLDNTDFGVKTEFVFVDDASSDESWQILQDFIFSRDVQRVRQDLNCGKGAAIHRGIGLARGDFVGIQDADFEYDPNDLKKLMQPLLEDRADVVYGSRFRSDGPQVHRTFHYLVNRLLTLLSNLLSGLYFSDMETCYKVFRGDLIRNIHFRSQRFGFEPEVTAHIARLKVRAQEFPISYFPRRYIEGKKITWKDGFAALFHIVRFNLFPLKPIFKETLPQRYRVSGRQWL